MKYRVRSKKTGMYYVPSNAYRAIDHDVGKVYKSVAMINQHVFDFMSKDDWEIVEFHSDRANGEIVE